VKTLAAVTGRGEFLAHGAPALAEDVFGSGRGPIKKKDESRLDLISSGDPLDLTERWIHQRNLKTRPYWNTRY
jgi:hypothetical protein